MATVRSIKEIDDLSTVPTVSAEKKINFLTSHQLLLEAFNGDISVSIAKNLVNAFRNSGLIAIEDSSGEIIGCTLLSGPDSRCER